MGVLIVCSFLQHASVQASRSEQGDVAFELKRVLDSLQDTNDSLQDIKDSLQDIMKLTRLSLWG